MNVIFNGFCVRVEDAPPELAKFLSAPFRTLGADDRLGHVVLQRRRLLCRRISAPGDSEGIVICPIPLWLAVRGLVEGEADVIYGDGWARLQRIVGSLPTPTDVVNQSLLRFVAENPCGMIGKGLRSATSGVAAMYWATGSSLTSSQPGKPQNERLELNAHCKHRRLRRRGASQQNNESEKLPQREANQK